MSQRPPASPTDQSARPTSAFSAGAFSGKPWTVEEVDNITGKEIAAWLTENADDEFLTAWKLMGKKRPSKHAIVDAYKQFISGEGDAVPKPEFEGSGLAPPPVARALTFRKVVVLVPFVMTFLMTTVTADDKPPHASRRAETLVGGALGAVGGAIAQNVQVLPSWLSGPLAAPFCGVVVGASLSQVSRHGWQEFVRIRKAVTGAQPPQIEKLLAAVSGAGPSLSAPAKEILQSWVQKWARAYAGSPGLASPLGLFGDATVAEVTSYLSAAASRDASCKVLEIDVVSCDGSGWCKDQITSFLVEGSASKQAGLLVLKNVDAFRSQDSEENSARFTETIGHLENMLDDTAKGGITLGRRSCRGKLPRGAPCTIFASNFAVLYTSTHLDTASCQARLSEATRTGSMMNFAAAERAQMWGRERFSPTLQNALPAIKARYTDVAALVCTPPRDAEPEL